MNTDLIRVNDAYLVNESCRPVTQNVNEHSIRTALIRVKTCNIISLQSVNFNVHWHISYWFKGNGLTLFRDHCHVIHSANVQSESGELLYSHCELGQ